MDLTAARFYLCIGLMDDVNDRVSRAIDGGIEIVQLRDKTGDRIGQLRVGKELRAICRDRNVPFIVNDDPQLALELDADGVHVGQDDLSVAGCRELLGPEAIVGLSTHTPDEFTAGLLSTATYLSAGPITATPTKPGRVGTGAHYASWAQGVSDRPVFVTGGVAPENVGDLVRAGLRHFVVVRAITNAADPYRAARALVDAYESALD
jgi:thiamine-phosphate pyrophosphorylase